MKINAHHEIHESTVLGWFLDETTKLAKVDTSIPNIEIDFEVKINGVEVDTMELFKSLDKTCQDMAQATIKSRYEKLKKELDLFSEMLKTGVEE